MKLTIAIPTFEREQPLNRLLSQVLQIDFTVDYEVLVVDNASTSYDVEALVGEFRKKNDKIKLIQNEVNIGMSANFMECYRKALGDWVWLIGDDDVITSSNFSELETCLLNANSDSSIAAINFSTNFKTHECKTCLRSFTDLGEDRGLFRNLLFLSATIFRREDLLPVMGLGYSLAGSMAPQMSMLLAQFPEKSIMLEPLESVRAGEGQASWSVDDFIMQRWDLLSVAKNRPLDEQEALRRFIAADRQTLVYYLRESPRAKQMSVSWRLGLTRFILSCGCIRNPKGCNEFMFSLYHLIGSVFMINQALFYHRIFKTKRTPTAELKDK